MRFAGSFMSVLLLAGCVSPEMQLRTSLTRAGLSSGLSDCMAREMTPRLSIRQLSRLRDLSHVSDRDPRKSGIDRILHQARALGDAQIWSVASVAGAHCAHIW